MGWFQPDLARYEGFPGVEMEMKWVSLISVSWAAINKVPQTEWLKH